MAQATNTTLGEIVLAGDLAGNDATAPQLRISGVTPGTYSMVQRASIDSKGRIVSIGTVTSEELVAIMQDADVGQRGVVQVGAGLEVSAGVLSLPNASTTTKGIASISDSRLVISGGVLSSAIPDAVQNSTKGLLQVATGTGLSVSGGSLSLDLATDTTPGRVAIGAGFMKNAAAGVLNVQAAPLSTAVAPLNEPGVCRPGTNMSVDGSGILSHSFPDATTSTKGIVRPGTNMTVVDGVLSYTGGGDATTSSLGIMQVGSGLSVNAGTISVQDATTTAKGIVSIGSGLSVSSGVVSTSIPDATTSSKGIVQIGSGLVIAGGVVTLDLPNATDSTKGVVTPFAGTGIAINSSGVMSADAALATTSSLGIIQPGNSMDVIGGSLQVAQTSATKKGIMQAGAGLVATAGVVSVDPLYMRKSVSYVRTFNEKQGPVTSLKGPHNGWAIGYPNATSDSNTLTCSLSNQSTQVYLMLPEDGVQTGSVFRVVVTHTGTSAFNVSVRSYNGFTYDVRGETTGSTKPFAQFTGLDGLSPATNRTWTTLPLTPGGGTDVFEFNIIYSGLALVTTITGY